MINDENDFTSARIRVTLTTKFPREISIVELRAWSALLFSSPSTGSNSEESTKQSDLEDQYIEFFAKLSQLSFELVRLPVFQVPTFAVRSNINSSGNERTLVVDLPYIAGISREVYRKVIRSSAILTTWISKKGSYVSRERFFSHYETKVIEPLKKVIPAGASTIPLLKSAFSLGMRYFHLGEGVYQIGMGSNAYCFDRSTTVFDSNISLKLSQNKAITANLLDLHGLPTPKHFVVGNDKIGIASARKIGFPVVVKPLDRDRGEGVTVNVTTDEAVTDACNAAIALSRAGRAIIEKQVPGVCHRLFVARDSLVYAVKRRPIGVIGDGISTINKLVEKELLEQSLYAPWNRSKVITLDAESISVLRSLGFDEKDIPKRGQYLPLRWIESTESGGIDEDFTKSVHPENVAIALRATRALKMEVAGVDIISTDITVPWYVNGAVINEVNFAPVLGAAEISRSYIPSYLSLFIRGNGSIPIRNFEDSLPARKFQSDCADQDLRCYVITEEDAFDPRGKSLHLLCRSVMDRMRALVLNPEVDAIAIVLGNAERNSKVLDEQ